MKTHRVGTVTLGITMVLFGSLFLLHLIFPGLSYGIIFRMWPLTLIGLGAEILAANSPREKVNFVYDKGAVFLLCLMFCFMMGMASVQYALERGAIVTW